MLTERHEEHRVYVTEGETWVDHSGCPRLPTGWRNYTWPACYVGTVAEGGEEPSWQELIGTLEPGVSLIATVVVERSHAPDDPLVTHTVEKRFASIMKGELQLVLRQVPSPLDRLLERLRRENRQR